MAGLVIKLNMLPLWSKQLTGPGYATMQSNGSTENTVSTIRMSYIILIHTLNLNMKGLKGEKKRNFNVNLHSLFHT